MLHHHNHTSIKPARVVILGSSGFIAQAIQRKLTEHKIPTLPLSRLDLDLTNSSASERLSSLLLPTDSLLFVAAKAPVKNDAMMLENLVMAKCVDEALQRSEIQHLVYISSDAVYADGTEPLHEGSCAQPTSLHGIMHLSREIMLRNAWHGPLCILRPTLVYGNGDPHNGYGPNRFLRLAKRGEDIVLFGEGEELRDHVWVEDVAEITWQAILRKSSGTLNIATGTVISFKAIAELILNLVGSASRLKGSQRVGPMPHNGYRAFGTESICRAFPEFHYRLLSDYLMNEINN